ncbi:MAG: DUF4105 domain-containing protein [Albidovulum sp.]
MRKLSRFAWRGFQFLLAALLIGWTALAVHFQFASPFVYLAYAVVAAVAIGFLWLFWQRRWRGGWIAMAVAVAAVALWWSTILPRQDRDWRPEVAHGVTATEEGGLVTLSNVRNFDFTTEEDAVARWETRTFDPDSITSVDMILSVWDSPEIAHTLVSFGFADGQHIVFSAEIRKEKSEEFSSLGGFFREFELVLIAADERDIVRLRTDVRGEEVALYPVDMDPAQRKALFLSFLDLGNELSEAPRWYNTITANCTTVPFYLVRRLSDRVVPDIRVLLSGRLPSYLHELGVLRPDMALDDIIAQARVAKLGPAIPDGVEFSRRVRAGWSE